MGNPNITDELEGPSCDRYFDLVRNADLRRKGEDNKRCQWLCNLHH